MDAMDLIEEGRRVNFSEPARDIQDETLTNPVNVANLVNMAAGYRKDCMSLPPRAFRCNQELFVGIDIHTRRHKQLRIKCLIRLSRLAFKASLGDGHRAPGQGVVHTNST